MKNGLLVLLLTALLAGCGSDEYEKARDLYVGSRTNVPSEQQGYSEPLSQATALLENFLSHNHEHPRAMLLLWRCYLRTGNPRAAAMHESMTRNAAKMRKVLPDEIADEADAYMRERIVQLFGEIATSAEVEDLVEILEEDAQPAVQEAAAQILARLRDERGLAPLLDKLEAQDPSVRAFVCRALAAFPQAHVLEQLAQVLLNDKEVEDVRAHAGFALAEIVQLHSELRSALVEKLQPPLSAANSPLTTQLLAAMVLAKLGLDSGKSLAEAQAHSPDLFKRGLAIIILGEIGSEAAVPLIAPAMLSDNSKLRLQAAEALGNLNDAKGLPSLYQAVDDPVESVRQAAQQAIEKIRRKTSPR
ncbi:MAG: HEAT repeat domain-containing protein [candidate division KSB1 bacterium]